MTVYLDTSTVLRVVLAQADPLAIWGKWDAACASELLGVEARRVLDRLRLEGALDDEQVGAFHAALAASNGRSIASASHASCSDVRHCRWRRR